MIVGIIPARYASTRFPGKPLAVIGKKTMIQRVYEQAKKCKLLDDLIVATDDKRIFDTVKSFGGKVMMTSSKHQNGTERIEEVAQKICKPNDIVINIQGDEPFLAPTQITKLISCFKNDETEIATLVKRIQSKEELLNKNTPKVAKDKKGVAVTFSREPVGGCCGNDSKAKNQYETYFKHIGIYAFRFSVLKKLVKLHPTENELNEKLEQLRWLDNDYTIQTAETTTETVAIDTPEDLKRALKLLKK